MALEMTIEDRRILRRLRDSISARVSIYNERVDDQQWQAEIEFAGSARVVVQRDVRCMGGAL